MDCDICFEKVSLEWMGEECMQCKKRCCIPCDIKSSSCPFCRNKISWTSRVRRINLEKFKKYLSYLNQIEYQKIIRYLDAKKLFIALVSNCPVARDIFYDIDDDEDLLNLMIIARDFVFGTAIHSKNIDDIDFLITIIEFLHDRLDNPDVDIHLDLDTIEELLFQDEEKIKKNYPKTPKKSYNKPTRYAKSNTFLRRRPHYRSLC